MLRDHLDAHLEDFDGLRAMEPAVDEIAARLVSALAQGGKILVCGNGGSAADAQHFAAELTGRFRRERQPFAAVALGAEVAALTAIANDYGYEQVFARQVDALARTNDVLLAISTSGASENCLRAVQRARRQGPDTLALTGPLGGPLADAAGFTLAAPGRDTARVQECHGFLLHVIADVIERRFSHE